MEFVWIHEVGREGSTRRELVVVILLFFLNYLT